MASWQSVLNFWFGNNRSIQNPLSFWWQKQPEVDALISRRFQPVVEALAEGLLPQWEAQSESRLAAIICLDQFPRHIYRGTKHAFAYDLKALQLVREGLKKKAENYLLPLEKTFFIMPLMHDETMNSQNACVALYQQFLADPQVMGDESGVLQNCIKGGLDYAIRHRDIIDRFGRFPHRNAELGRPSTPEELVFLKQPGSSF
ncbi:hypothetical protein CI610_01777 [invertebrate metagenome]|uniref:Transmembrane protein n=1 Tax=invertebrate metagenome TaxID=1711999 RepID=A0A2H9T7T5_9ZZZZ